MNMETVNETIKEFSALTASRLSGVVGEASKLCSVRIVILLLAVMTTMTAGAQDDSWSSNVNDNYELFQDYDTEDAFEISTAADLANFASFVNDDHDFEGKTVMLGDDIDLSAHFWDLLIGRYGSCCFKGTFDGNGKVIKGLVTPDTGFDNGLFGYNEGTVKNVILDALCSITGEGDLGGIVNYNYGTVESCACAATLTGDEDREVGGIVGINEGTVRNCYFVGPYSDYIDHVIYGDDYYGQGTMENCCYYDEYFQGKDRGCEQVFRISLLASCTITAVDDENNPIGIRVGQAFYVTESAKVTVTLDDPSSDFDVYDSDGDHVNVDAGQFSMPRNDVTLMTSDIIYFGGMGTEDAPFLIETAADLEKMATCINSGLYSKAFFRLEDKIDYDTDGLGDEESNFTPIGNSEYAFKGTFDGNGQAITGIRLRRPTGSFLGFFGNNAGTVKNLIIMEAEITGNGYVGGIAGGNNGHIENVSFSGDINGRNYVGGIAGRNDGDIIGCFSDAEISSTGKVGGIVGHNSGSITDCLFNGNFSGTTDAMGVAGTYTSYSSIVNSYSTEGNFDEMNHKAAMIDTRDAITLEIGDATATYNVSSLTAYGNNVLEYLSSNLYSGYGNEIPFSYSGSDLVWVSPHAADATIANDKLTVGSNDIVLTAHPVTITIPTQHHNGTALTPVITATANGGALDTNGRFTCTTAGDCILPGNYTVTVSGQGDCYGSTTATFTIDLYDVTIADDADNTDAIDLCSDYGNLVNMTISGRRFYKDADWNTLCLPFDVTDGDDADGITFSGTPLEGAAVKTLSSADFSNGTLTLTFTDNLTAIEAGKPYIVKWPGGLNLTINNVNDWNAFAAAVTGGNLYDEKTVLLNTDLSVSTMVGTPEHPFCGIFDGNGHTLNVSINASDDDYAAPFRCISNATVRNLKVTGAVTGGQFCAGIVGAAKGSTNSIRNCWMNANVTGESYIGGVLGHGTTSATTISNCYMNGTLHGYGIGVFCGGGTTGGTHTAVNCWSMGEYSYVINGGGINLVKSDGTAIVNSCGHNSDDIPQGDKTLIISFGNGFVTTMANYLGSQWTVENDALTLKPTSELLPTYLDDPVFTGVTVSSTPANVETDYVDFVGTYSPVSYSEENRSILFLGTNNTLYYPQSGASIGACRAYFQLKNGLTVGDPALSRFVLRFVEDPSTQGDNFDGGETASMHNAQCTMHNEAGAWYTLDGRKLDAKPTKSGLYIHNGNKVVIK